ncbi:MAG: tetratricopeptide repeat protein [Tannerella sp.]|jgi:tetratricopeptide (TPR) repeat protein|nr:tetratricopeptide repeat protein [Tannerella sp.]
MTVKEIHIVYGRILDSVDNKALKTAFDRLQELITGAQLHSFQSKLDEVQEVYRYMLRYYVEGTDDPMREQIYATIRTGIYELADQVKHGALSAESPQVYYMNLRTQAYYPIDAEALIKRLPVLSDVEDRDQFESSIDKLFNKLWITAFLSEKDADIVRAVLKNDDFPLVAKCQAISALWLGLQASFDKEKLYLLFDAAGSTEDEVRIRAYITICLTLYAYRNRSECYSGIQQRLDTLAETSDFKRILSTIILRFILSRETEKVTHKVEEEIIPEMIDFMIRPVLAKSKFLFDFSENEMNPDWGDFPSNSSLAEKMEEYGRMQEEGMDVMHSTFIRLKNFPFFRNVSNWFLPFTLKYSAFRDIKGLVNSTLETMVQASFMCNSDKYSLYFSLSQMPERHRNMIMRQMDSQMFEMKRQKAAKLLSKQSRVEDIVGQYVHDLYRFYKLYSRRAEFEDIFNWPLDFHYLPILKPYLSDAELLLNFAELYLRKGYFENAQTIYTELIARDGNDEILYQKLGYCKQMTGDFKGALDEYQRSEMMNPNSKWVMRRIAGCYRALKQPEEALSFYIRYDKLSPDNIPLLINIGHCYMDLKQYDEALKYYFKADYLDPKSHKAWRAIAWCSFLAGKFDQARNYYEKILEEEEDPLTQDYLNAGHTELCLHHIRKALTHYQSALLLISDEFKQFLILFEPDIPDLIHAGISAKEIPLVLDQLRYELKFHNGGPDV